MAPDEGLREAQLVEPLGLGVDPFAARETALQRAGQHDDDQPEQRHRDEQLDQREAGLAVPRPSHRALAALRESCRA